jgi:dienelactone hydrolase
VPSGTVWCGVPPIGHSAWSYQGQEVPFAEGPSGVEWAAALAEGTARDDTDWYRLAARNQASMAAAEIAVEKIQGPLLLLSAKDDRLWPCSEFAEGVVRRCREKNFPHAVQHVDYPGAGHDLRWPHAPATVTRYVHSVTQEVVDMGGTPQATARARVDSWQRTLAFFRQHLPPGAP